MNIYHTNKIYLHLETLLLLWLDPFHTMAIAAVTVSVIGHSLVKKEIHMRGSSAEATANLIPCLHRCPAARISFCYPVIIFCALSGIGIDSTK